MFVDSFVVLIVKNKGFDFSLHKRYQIVKVSEFWLMLRVSH